MYKEMNSPVEIPIVVLISGNGSNLQVLIDRVNMNSELEGCKIVGVISNRAKAYGLERAKLANIPTSILNLKKFKDEGKTREDYDLSLSNLVLSYKPKVIVLAGFMHILSPTFLDKINTVPTINLHPALPNMFNGVKAIERAYEAFQKGEIDHTGIMVHKVIKEVDEGQPIVLQEVEIFKEDTLEDLETRIHKAEHVLLFKGLKIVVEEIKNGN